MSNRLSSPLLTIAIPTYNRAENLETRLLELKKQYQKNFRVVVSDNGSNDQTLQILRKYKAEMPYLRYNRFKKNQGVDANMLKLYEMTDTDFLWFTSDSYEIQPNAAEQVIKSLKRNPVSVLICGHVNEAGVKINSEGKNIQFGCLEDVSDYSIFYMANMLSVLVIRKMPDLDYHLLTEYFGTWYMQITLQLHVLSKNFGIRYEPSLIVTKSNPNYVTSRDYLQIWLIGPLKAVRIPNLPFDYENFRKVKSSEWRGYLHALNFGKLGAYSLQACSSRDTWRQAFDLLGYRALFYFIAVTISKTVPLAILRMYYGAGFVRNLGFRKGIDSFREFCTRAKRQTKFSSY